MMLSVVHLLLGYRELHDTRYYRDGEMVKRLLGLKRLPDVATVSRTLAGVDERCVDNVRAESRALVLGRLDALSLARVTADFDGSVQNTGRCAEGTAVGFNKSKKGRRSYCNGAKSFILQCLSELWEVLPGAQVETRIDSAFLVSKSWTLSTPCVLRGKPAFIVALEWRLMARTRVDYSRAGGKCAG